MTTVCIHGVSLDEYCLQCAMGGVRSVRLDPCPHPIVSLPPLPKGVG